MTRAELPTSRISASASSNVGHSGFSHSAGRPRCTARRIMNSIDAGKSEPPYGYVLPVQRDMTR